MMPEVGIVLRTERKADLYHIGRSVSMVAGSGTLGNPLYEAQQYF